MHSSGLPALDDLETVNENLVTVISEIVYETDYKGDAWIRQHSHPLLIEK